jgi:hypothetical protein
VTFETKDSGVMEDFPSGMRRDARGGKPRFDLLLARDVPCEEQMLTRWAQLMTRGAVKYGERNWEKADSEAELARMRESAFRHLIQWLTGEDDEDHAAAVLFNICGAELIRYRLRAAPASSCGAPGASPASPG